MSEIKNHSLSLGVLSAQTLTLAYNEFITGISTLPPTSYPPPDTFETEDVPGHTDTPTPAPPMVSTTGMGTKEDDMRTMSASNAAVQLAGLLFNLTGHDNMPKADLYAAGKQLFPLVKKHGFSDVARIINWSTTLSPFWSEPLMKANFPAATFVKHFAKIHQQAAAELRSAEIAAKRKNPGYNPDFDDPSTPDGQLIRAFR